MKRFILILLFLSLIINSSAYAEIKVIKLSYSNPESIVTTLTNLYGNKIKVSAVPMINSIVVNSNNNKIITEIENLIRSLDRKPATLIFTIHRLENDTQHNSLSGYNTAGKKGIAFETKKWQKKSNSFRTITALEFNKASFTDSTLKVFAIPTYYGAEANVITTTRGLKISGQLINNKSVLVSLWYSTGSSFSESEELLTSLEVPLSVWFQIGGSNSNNKNNSSSQLLKAKEHGTIDYSRNKAKGYINRTYKVKVDIIQ